MVLSFAKGDELHIWALSAENEAKLHVDFDFAQNEKMLIEPLTFDKTIAW